MFYVIEKINYNVKDFSEPKRTVITKFIGITLCKRETFSNKGN